MITEKEVAQAIQECMREPVTSNKRSVLADLIIIQDYLFGEPVRQQEATRSYSAPPPEQVEVQVIVEANGDSEFLRAIDGRKADRAWNLMNELVEAVKILHPQMYNTFIDKVQDL